jgi:transposase
MPRQYPPEFRQRALRMLEEALPDYESEFEAIRQVATKLGVSTEALRKWRRTSEIDSGARPGMTSAEHAELKRLKKENAELRRANEILKAASAFFAAELDRPTTR